MSARSDYVWPWVVDCAIVLYIAWVARVSALRVGAFEYVFRDFGADVPAITWFVIKACRPPIPYVVAALIGIALAVKNRSRVGTVSKLGISVLVLVLVVVGTSFILGALFRPLIDLIEKMSGR